MKRKQLMALLGIIAVTLSSCSAAPAAAEAVTEGEISICVEEPAPDVPVVMPEETDTDPPAEDPLPGETGGTSGPAGESVPGETIEDPPEAQTPGADDPAHEEETTSPDTEAETPAETVPETESETPALSETQAPDSPSADQNAVAGESAAESETQILPETESETRTEDPGNETEKAAKEEPDGNDDPDEDSPVSYGGGGYYWDESWFVSSDFRFTRIDKTYALVDDIRGTFIYEEEKDTSRKVGEIPYSGVVCILKDPGGEFDYVECGDIRGFARKEVLRTGDDAQSIIDMVGEDALTQGELLIEKADNEAFTYTKTTSYQVIARKKYAMSLTGTWIYEYPDEKSRFVGDLSNGSLSYILSEAGDDWYFIESGDVRGFVKKSALLIGSGAKKIAKDLGEENAPLAEELVKPEDNRSIYYTLLSVKSAESSIALDICQAATGFVGKLPYVYGGTSLVTGADCSGFVQSVFDGFGIKLPRTAEEQGANGQEVSSLAEAKPGDIIYYASGPHVGIYLGDGKVVQCSGRSYNTADNPGRGPTISDVTYMPVTSIRRYLIVRESADGEGGYRRDDTPYTDEQLEIIWAVVAQEDNGSYEGALAVISSAMNRTESSAWSYEGSNAYAQLTAAGQYCYSLDRYWVSRLNGNVPEYVKQAVNDCLRKGIRNHGHTSFRSTRGKTTGADAVQIGGNWYFGS